MTLGAARVGRLRQRLDRDDLDTYRAQTAPCPVRGCGVNGRPSGEDHKEKR